MRFVLTDGSFTTIVTKMILKVCWFLTQTYAHSPLIVSATHTYMYLP
jgi:hypothetical protein